MSRQREWQIKKIEEGNCPRCGKKVEDRHYFCISCREKINKEKRERNRIKKLDGVCVYCGKTAMEGCSLCKKCSDKNKENSKRNYRKNKEEILQKSRNTYEERKKKGLCVRCGKDKKGEYGRMCKSCRMKIEHYKKTVKDRKEKVR